MIGTDKFTDEKCLICKFLPVCNGGCNLYRMEKLENNTPYDICPIDDKGFIKYMESFMKKIIVRKSLCDFLHNIESFLLNICCFDEKMYCIYLCVN